MIALPKLTSLLASEQASIGMPMMRYDTTALRRHGVRVDRRGGLQRQRLDPAPDFGSRGLVELA